MARQPDSVGDYGDKPLTLAAYESVLVVRADVEYIAHSDALLDVPLFLKPRAHVEVPLAAAYDSAFAAVRRRWRRLLDEDQ